MPTLDMWWKDDIANVLKGIAVSTPLMGAELPADEAEAFRDGFYAALSAISISLGIVNYERTNPARVRLLQDKTKYLRD